jgi:hypothetical protein
MLEYPDPPDHDDREQVIELGPEMSDAETAATIREWCSKSRSPWAWPTDPCGYEQHIKFVQHRNANLKTGEDFNAFALAYADTLDPPRNETETRDAERAVTPAASEAP